MRITGLLNPQCGQDREFQRPRRDHARVGKRDCPQFSDQRRNIGIGKRRAMDGPRGGWQEDTEPLAIGGIGSSARYQSTGLGEK